MIAQPRPLSAQALYDLPVVSSCALDPRVQRVAYAVSWGDKASNGYRGSIRVAEVVGGSIRTYTHGRQRDLAPRWSADGTQLLFLSDRNQIASHGSDGADSGGMQLWSIDAAGGEPEPLPCVAGSVSEFAVSPDGRFVAAVATPDTARRAIEQQGWRRITRLRYRADGVGYLDDPARLWLIDLRANSVRELGDASGFDAAPAWSPDGVRLAFAGEHDADADMLWHHELWIADARNDFQRRCILRMQGALEMPAWSPDGTTLAFIGLEGASGAAGLKNLRLFTVGADGAGLRCWTEREEWNASNAVLTDTGVAGNLAAPVWLGADTIAVLGTRRGCAQVFAVSATGAARALTSQTHSAVEFACASPRNGVMTATDGATPPEVYAWSEGEALRPLTRETEQWCAAAGVRRPVRFQVTGPGGTIDSWYLRSAEGDRRQPAILQIHGGPHFSYGEAFLFEFQLLAAHGFDVVYCNPRGSQGYGEAFAGAIVGDWATPAFVDCMAVLDAALATRPIDPHRLGVAGGSYGGYLTAWTVGHTARFAAAIAMRPATNLTSLWGTSEVGRMLNDELGGRPADIPEVYRHCSPLTYADAITTPLLITHAENDFRCPIEQAEQLFTALRTRGQTVELLRFLNADHGMSRTGLPNARVARLQAIVEWFERYLAAPATATTSEPAPAVVSS